MSLLLLRIPNDDDLFNVDVSRHSVFFQVKHVAFDLGRFTAYRNPLATNLDLFAQAVLKKISHSHYSSVNWVSTSLRFYPIVLPMRNLMAARELGQDNRRRRWAAPMGGADRAADTISICGKDVRHSGCSFSARGRCPDSTLPFRSTCNMPTKPARSL